MHNRKSMRSFKGEQGFTLIELVVAVIILGILAGVVGAIFHTSRSKATALVEDIQTVADGMTRLNLDASCYPSHTGALIDKSDATSSFCGQNLQPLWKGPYIKSQAVNTSGDIELSGLSPTATLTIGQGDNLNGDGNTIQYYIEANNVPATIVTKAYQSKACGNGSSSGRCIEGTASNGLNSLKYIFAESN